MKIKTTLSILILFILVVSCKNSQPDADAYGNFEAETLNVSSEVAGKLLEFNIKEGDVLEVGEVVGQVDTITVHLQIMQLEAKKQAVSARFPAILTQVAVLEQQLHTLDIEKLRLENLLADKAATPKQLDDVNGQYRIIESQIENVKSQNAPIFAELAVIDASIDLLSDQLKRAEIVNPVKGTVLDKFAKASEMLMPGKTLYKLANLDEITLRAYVSETQLSEIMLGDTVTVAIDNNENGMSEFKGVIYWVSPKAEFTPKIIQTRKERVNLVYAFKIKLSNNGSMKIGMPAEVYFKK